MLHPLASISVKNKEVKDYKLVLIFSDMDRLMEHITSLEKIFIHNKVYKLDTFISIGDMYYTATHIIKKYEENKDSTI
jgi:hypothetical protein